MSNRRKSDTLPLWRHHKKVILPVVFFVSDGTFIDSSRLSTSSLDSPQFDNESFYIRVVARNAHEKLLADSSAADAVQFVMNEFSKSNGRWPCRKGSDLFQSSFIMDGDTKKSGAVVCYRSKSINAVDAARFVLDNTEYSLLFGDECSDFVEHELGEKKSFVKGDSSESLQSCCNEDSYIYESNIPMNVYVIAADKTGNIACGFYGEDQLKEKASRLKNATIVGNSLYADSNIGSALAISLDKTHNVSGVSLAWQTTQLMRDFQTENQANGGIALSLSSYLSNSLQRYVDELTLIFALHKCGDLPTMKMSIFSFSQPEPPNDQWPAHRQAACISLISGISESTNNNFYWSTILEDLQNLSSSSIFDSHPYGNVLNPSPSLEMYSSDDFSDHPVAILVHGGAGAGILVTYSSDYYDKYMTGVKRAVSTGYQCLVFGAQTAVQAVREAIRVMEDEPVFNAGIGSCLTRNKLIEMDAILFDGASGRFGAAGAVKNVKNCVELCSQILDDLNHKNEFGGELLLGDLALDYALENGIEVVDQSELVTEKALKALERWRRLEKVPKVSTIGAVAIDRFGNVAAATSTGGVTGQIDSRIGDVSLPGCGTAADNRLGAVSVSGIGEHIMATCTARACLDFVEKGFSAQQASELAVQHLNSSWKGSKEGGSGGLICMGPSRPRSSDQRRWGVAFNTEAMPWAAVDSCSEMPQILSGFWSGEEHSEVYVYKQK